jgi:hypothetical protein
MSHFDEFELSQQILKNTQIPESPHQWEPSCSMPTEGQVTDRRVEADSPFCKFVNTSKNHHLLH